MTSRFELLTPLAGISSGNPSGEDELLLSAVVDQDSKRDMLYLCWKVQYVGYNFPELRDGS